MENSQPNKTIENELRQSDEWAKYLEWLGWKTKETSKGIKIYLRKTPFGKVAKVQRPGILSAYWRIIC